MFTLTEIKSRIERGINTFVSVCINANRDLPFHDYYEASIGSAGQYVVGASNINATGDQKKFFVSKSTLIWAPQDSFIKFNNANNVVIYLLANVWYEFKSNIHTVFWNATQGENPYMELYFEGVMYHEARRPE